MSYCRFAWGGSDVYVFESDRGIECCGCNLDGSFVADTPEAMIAHLVQHKRAGHFVLPNVIEVLWSEIDGPNEPVRPEPESLTQCREMMKVAKRNVKAKLAAEYSHL